MKNVVSKICLSLVSVLLIFSSCKIGLGEAVDTFPPTVTVTTPEADAQVRETFTMSGAWSDDLSVSKIQIVLTNINTEAEYGPFTATKAGSKETEGTWSCAISPVVNGKIEIPDGVYTATITVFDTYDQTGTATQTFSIDNTAPVVVLSSPSTIDIANPTSYGQTFSVEGKAWDDSDVDSIDVVIYDEEGTALATKTLKNVSTQIAVDAAVWGDEIYNAIYGANKEAGTKSYYVGVIAYDGSRKVPAVDGDRGNSTPVFYLANDFADIEGFKTSIAYKLLNGSRSAADYSTWVAALTNKKIEKATISLNPVNNPYFEVQNYEPITLGKENELEHESGKYKFTNKSTGSLNLFVGRDKKSIKVDTIGVYLKECNVKGEILENGKTITLLQPYSDKDGNIYKNASGKELISQAAHTAAITTVGSTSYKTSFTLNVDEMEGLSVGTYYRFEVVAYDYANVGIRNDNIYAIKLVSASSSPTVTITEPSGISKIIKMGDGFDVKGKIVSELKEVLIHAYINYEDTNSVPFASSDENEKAPVAIKKTKTSAEADTTRTWDFELSVPQDKNRPASFNVSVIVSDPSEPSVMTKKDIEVTNDTEVPKFGSYSISPTVEETVNGVTTAYVNGVITIKQEVSDNNIVANTWYSLDDKATWINVGKTTMMSFLITTTNYADNSTKKVWLKAIDSADNENITSIDLNIKQSSDAPVISLSNCDVTQATTEDIIEADSSNKNIFGIVANNTLLGTITDDDGIQTITISRTTDGTTWTPDVLQGGSKTSYNLIYKLPETQGDYTLKIEVTDTKNQTSYSTTVSPSFAIAIDEGAPNFIVTTTSGALQAVGIDLPVTGNWSDGTPITIQRCANADGTGVDAAEDTDIIINDDGTWKDKIPAHIVGTDGGTRYYIATDKYGQKTTQVFNFKVDSLPPTFKITDVNGIKENGNLISLDKNSAAYPAYAKTSGIFTIKGTVAEPDPDTGDVYNEGSGLEDFIYYYITKDVSDIKINETTGTYEIDGNGKNWSKASITRTTKETGNSENGTWTANIDISSGYAEGTQYTIYFAAKDNARNVSKIDDNPSAKVVLTPDEKPPVFTDKDSTKDGVQALEISNTNIIGTTNEDIIFTVDVDDATSGIGSVKLYRNGVDTEIASVHSNGTTTYVFKILKTELDTKLSAGTNSFKVRATDNVGNYDDCSAVEVNVDRTAPKISIGGVSPTVVQGGNTYYNGKVTLTGVATDETCLKEIRYFFGDVASPYTAVSGQVLPAVADGTYKAYEFEIDTRNLTDNATTKITVVAVDKAGNLSSISTKDIAVNQNTDKPVITLNSPLNNTNFAQTDIASGNNLFKTSGTISAEISDDDGIAKIEILVNGTKVDSETIDLSSSKPTSYSASWTLANLGITSVGDKTIQIKVTDSALGVYTETNTINIGIDNGAPSLSITTTVSDEKKKNSIYYVKKSTTPVTVTAKVQDDYKLGSVSDGTTTYTSSSTPALKEDATEQTFTFNYPIPASSEKKIFTFTAKDKFGQPKVETQTYVFDVDAPVIENYTYSKSASSGVYYYTKDNSFTITGKAKEGGSTAELQSGLNNVDFIVYSGHYDSFTAAASATVTKDWQSTTGTSSWTAKLDTDSITAEGEYTVFIRATDFAGNETISPAIKVVADAAKPVVAITKINGTAATAVDSYYTGAVTIEGTVTETYLRGFTVTATKDGTSVNTVTVDTAPATTGKQTAAQPWKITIPANDGDYKITITASDEINKGDTATKFTDIKFALDTTAPTFTITDVKDQNFASGLSAVVSKYGNTTDYFTIKGTVADGAKSGAAYASGLENYIYYFVTKTSLNESGITSYTIDESTWSSAPIKKNGTWEAPVLFSNFADGDTCRIYFAVKDKAGNTSTISGNPSNKITVKIDQTAPTVRTPVLNIGADTTTITIKANDGASGSGLLATSAVIKRDGSAYTKATCAPTVNTGATDSTYVFTIQNNDAGLSVGRNTFTITITDDAGNHQTSSDIVINNNAPVLSATANYAEDAKNGKFVFVNKAFTISGNVSVSDNNKLASLKWQDDNGTATDITSSISNADATKGNYSITVTPDSRKSKITKKITATNVYGESSTEEILYIFDTDAPTFTLSEIAGESTGIPTASTNSFSYSRYGNRTDYFTIKGSADDGTSTATDFVSGLNNSIYYKVVKAADPIDETSLVNYANVSSWTNASIKSNKTFEIPVSFASFAEGDECYIYIAAMDNVGNTSKIAGSPSNKIKVIVDSEAPVIKTPTLTIGTENTVIEVHAKDAVSGINSISIKLNNKDYTKATLDSFAAPATRPTDSDGYSIYKYTISNSDAALSKGENKISVTFTDNNNNSATSDEVTINNNAPSIDVDITGSDAKNKNGLYVLENSTFEIKGTNVKVAETDDSNLMGTVTWVDTDSAGNTLKSGDAEIGTGVNANTITLSVNPKASEYTSYENKKVTRTFTATNIYGQSTTATVRFMTDIHAPVLLSDTDDHKLKQDGKIYDSENLIWYNSKSLGTSGYYSESGSGIEQGLYVVKNKVNNVSAPDSGEALDLIQTGTFGVTGSTGQFNFITSTFEEGTNDLYFVVVDKAGNYSPVQHLTIKIDITAPTIDGSQIKVGTDQDALETEKTRVLSNGDAAIYINFPSGSVKDEDNGSGLKEVKISLDSGSTWTIDAVLNNTTKDYLATIPTTSLTESGNVYARITDIAGNNKDQSLFILTVDKTAPEGEISSPTDADVDTAGVQVNKTITLSGNAMDNYNLAASPIVAVEFSSDYSGSGDQSAATWTALSKDGANSTKNAGANYVISGTSNWKAENIDTTKFTDGTYYFRAELLDEAGNTGYTPAIALIIDQSTDRPEIKIPSLADTTASIQEGTVMGTISDDDGIDHFYYANAATAPSVDAAGWNEITVSSGSWKIENLPSGNHNIWFKVEDKAGTKFVTSTTSGAAAALTRPYLTLSSGENGAQEKSDNNASIKLAVDLDAPQISTLKFAATANTVAAYTNVADDDWIPSTTASGVTNSPDKPYLYVMAEVVETVAMNETAANDISVSLGNSTLTGTITKSRGTGDNVNKYTYYVGPIDLSETISSTTTDGTKTVTVAVKDKSGRSSSDTYNIYIDGHAPTVTVSYPKTDADIKKTDVITGKVTVLGNVSDSTRIGSVYWMIPTKTQQEMTDEQLLALEDSSWTLTGITGNLFASLSLEFTDSSLTSGTNSIVYYAKDTTTYSTKADDFATSGNVTLPIYFKTADSSGNVGISKTTITLNPDGGIPTVELSSHEDRAKTSGTVNLMGTAADDENVASVKITKLEYTTATTIPATNATTGWTTVSDCSVAGLVVNGTAGTGDAKNTITCAGTTSWKASIDTSKIADGVTAIRVTVESFDANGTSSSATPIHGSAKSCVKAILVDKSNPELVSASIVGFASAPADTTVSPIYEKEYSAGMYISKKNAAKLYLKAVVSDDSSVEGITVTPQTGTGYASALDTTTANWIATDTGAKTYTVLIPIDSDKAGHIYATMELKDGQHTDVYSTFNFYIDNTAPAIFAADNTEITGADATTAVRLYNASNQLLNKGTPIENSNGSFVFGDSIKEAGSGLQYLAFWFGRKPKGGSAETKVYNPMVKNTSATFAGATGTDGAVYVNDDGLAAMYVKGNVSAPSNGSSTFTATTAANINANVRVGGLIKYDGAYRLITAVSGATVTFTPAASAKTGANAELIYAQVVDHQGIEVGDLYNDKTNGDGDGMTEVLKVKGAEYTWQASLDSKNIPDGPIYIHVVAIDNAGNISSAAVETSVANARPRITRVLLATDLNGNNTFDFYNESASILNDLSKDNTTTNGTEFGEFVFYSTLKPSEDVTNKVGDGQSKVTLNAPKDFTVKKDLLVLPEFVGGNGQLKYAYSIGTAAATNPVTSDNPTALVYTIADEENDVNGLPLADKSGTKQSVDSLIQKTKDASGNYTTTVDTNYGGAVIKMDSTDDDIKALDDGNTRYVAFTFWDETEETTQGTDSLWAMINIPVLVDVTDSTKPTADIRPFYWNSKEDSSFVYDGNGNPLGHIDLPSGTEKPGVAGQVYIEGTAHDETRLGGIYITEPSGTSYQVAEYKNGVWITDPANFETAVTWVNIKSSEVTTVYEPSQKGHEVKFKVAIDMTAYGIGEDQDVKVYAVDAQSNTQATAYSYTMDFVPYIKSIYTESADSANRSRLGRFPVQAGQDMIIEGMNFATDATYKVYYYKTGTTAPKDTDTATIANTAVTKVENGKIKVTAPEYSRFVAVSVNGVMTKNNSNENGGYNVEAGFIASDEDFGKAAADRAGTNFWTDDRYVSVWNSETNFPGSSNPHSGAVKKITELNSGSKTPGNDVAGGGYLYKQSGQGSAVDNYANQNNHYYAAISSDDLKAYGYMSTRNNQTTGYQGGQKTTLGDNIIFGSSECCFRVPVDEMDYTIVNGLPYYVMQDNFVDGDSGNRFGPGLFLSREGFNWNRNALAAANGSDVEEGKDYFIIERHGKSGAAIAGRDHTTGYDAVLQQFKNPRITGYSAVGETICYYDDKTVTGVDYIYVSYYDSYAKCLKYAAYKVGHRFDGDKIAWFDSSQWGQANQKCDIVPLMHAALTDQGAGNNSNNVSASNHMTDGATVVAGYDSTTATAPTSFKEEAGEWSDILIDKNDKNPIIVYYNKTKKCVEIAKGSSKAPNAGRVNGAEADSTAWSKTLIKPEGTKDFGRYVSATMDGSGNIHLVAADADTKKLYYVYISGSTFEEISSCVVADVNARWTDIELKNPSATTIEACSPVISFIDTASLGNKDGGKVAYVEKVINNSPVFEVISDPANYAPGDQRTSVMADVYEGVAGGETPKAKVAIGFNSDLFCVDFLRDE